MQGALQKHSAVPVLLSYTLIHLYLHSTSAVCMVWHSTLSCSMYSLQKHSAVPVLLSYTLIHLVWHGIQLLGAVVCTVPTTVSFDCLPKMCPGPLYTLGMARHSTLRGL
jgi:hypothetical protein